jgi:hypothetical protein
VPLKVLIDLDDKQHAATVDPCCNVFGAPKVGPTLKDPGSIQAGEQGGRSGAVILVKNRVGGGAEVETGGIAKD